MSDKPLTDEELNAMGKMLLNWEYQTRGFRSTQPDEIELQKARAIEATIAHAREANDLRGDHLCRVHGGRVEDCDRCVECLSNAASNYRTGFEDARNEANDLRDANAELVKAIEAERAPARQATLRAAEAAMEAYTSFHILRESMEEQIKAARILHDAAAAYRAAREAEAPGPRCHHCHEPLEPHHIQCPCCGTDVKREKAEKGEPKP